MLEKFLKCCCPCFIYCEDEVTSLLFENPLYEPPTKTLINQNETELTQDCIVDQSPSSSPSISTSFSIPSCKSEDEEWDTL